MIFNVIQTHLKGISLLAHIHVAIGSFLFWTLEFQPKVNDI